VDFLPKVKIEVVLPDDLVEKAIEAVLATEDRQVRRREDLHHRPLGRGPHPHRRGERRRCEHPERPSGAVSR
jgi:hypothetical protein